MGLSPRSAVSLRPSPLPIPFPPTTGTVGGFAFQALPSCFRRWRGMSRPGRRFSPRWTNLRGTDSVRQVETVSRGNEPEAVYLEDPGKLYELLGIPSPNTVRMGCSASWMSGTKGPRLALKEPPRL
jgi:hypothetical protein